MPVGHPKMGGWWWRGLTECGPLEKGMANHFSILALRTPWTAWKGKKIGHWKELPRSVGAQYATGDQWRNNSRKNEGCSKSKKQNKILKQNKMKKQYPVVDVMGDGRNVWCCKQQYYIGNWNARFMNQHKLQVVKQEMARLNINILGNQRTKMDWNGWI